jgi:hypothetical protein
MWEKLKMKIRFYKKIFLGVNDGYMEALKDMEMSWFVWLYIWPFLIYAYISIMFKTYRKYNKEVRMLWQELKTK